jgi:hypothetical protein
LALAPITTSTLVKPKSELERLTEAVRKAEAELDAATTRSALNAAAKRLMTTRAALKRLQDQPAGASPGHSVRGQGRAFPERLAIFAQLVLRLLKVLDELGDLLPGVVGRVLLEEPAQQGAGAGQGQADREHQVLSE